MTAHLTFTRRSAFAPAAAATAFAALFFLMSAAGDSVAQTSPTILQGPWGEMREESPAGPVADPGDAAIRLRQQSMRAVSSQFRTIEALYLAGTPFTPLSQAAARTLHDLGQRNTGLFAVEAPRRTPFGAKAAIWQEPKEFAEHVAEFSLATGRLLQAVETSATERLQSELAAVRYQCLACHYHYAF
ncbi:MAG: cytochrome c [Alphaproteobacteria bacterium]|nr:cytochrome c [Alphaproteobacteria bacterium]